MKIVDRQSNVPGIPEPNEVSLIFDSELPPVELITAAFGLVFKEGKLLMTRLRARGWDIPGGHVESEESPHQTMRREVLEETGAEVGVYDMLGYQKIAINAPKPERYKYPYPVSYQLFYWGRVAQLHPFTPTDEASKRGLFTPEEAVRLPWVSNNRSLYDLAYRRAMST